MCSSFLAWVAVAYLGLSAGGWIEDNLLPVPNDPCPAIPPSMIDNVKDPSQIWTRRSRCLLNSPEIFSSRWTWTWNPPAANTALGAVEDCFLNVGYVRTRVPEFPPGPSIPWSGPCDLVHAAYTKYPTATPMNKNALRKSLEELVDQKEADLSNSTKEKDLMARTIEVLKRENEPHRRHHGCQAGEMDELRIEIECFTYWNERHERHIRQAPGEEMAVDADEEVADTDDDKWEVALIHGTASSPF